MGGAKSAGKVRKKCESPPLQPHHCFFFAVFFFFFVIDNQLFGGSAVSQPLPFVLSLLVCGDG